MQIVARRAKVALFYLKSLYSFFWRGRGSFRCINKISVSVTGSELKEVEGV